jgi:hypothetical protein
MILHDLLRGYVQRFICRWFSYLTGDTPIYLHGLLRGYVERFICRWCSYLIRNTPMILHDLLRGYVQRFICRWCTYLIRSTPMILHDLLREDMFSVLYVDDSRTSQETHLCNSTSCSGGSCTFLLFHIESRWDIARFSLRFDLNFTYISLPYSKVFVRWLFSYKLPSW